MPSIVGGAPDIPLDRITRPAAYGLTASTRTSASARALDIEAGRPFRIGDLAQTPFVGLTHLDGFTETYAVGNTVAYRGLDVFQTTTRLGADLAFYGLGDVIPSLRVAYDLAAGPQGRTGFAAWQASRTRWPSLHPGAVPARRWACATRGERGSR